MNFFKKFFKNYYKIFNLYIENRNIVKSRKYIRNNHDKLIKDFPNLAVFAFDRIGLEISVTGRYEKNILDRLNDTVFNFIDCKNTVCLDIGANIGNHSLFFANFFKKVHSFEPHPDVFELLKFNSRNNKNINIFQFALSNENKKMDLKTDQATHYGASSLEFKNLSKSFHASNVHLKKFDDISEEIIKENKLSFIKLDAENHELKVLEGMKQTLIKHSPIICFEQSIDVFDYYNDEISSTTINYLKLNNYKYFYILPTYRNWKFRSNNFPILNKISHFIEIIFFGLPKRSKQLLKIKKFSKKTYYAIIVSKSPIDN